MKRIALLLNALLTLNHASDTPSTTPGCNYAGEFAINIPIDACVRRFDTSYKYVCNEAGDGVIKQEFNGDRCKGQPDNEITSPDGIFDFECGLSACTYTEQCVSINCDDACGDCSGNPRNDAFETQCEPFIEDVCIGGGPVSIRNTCEDGESTYFEYFDFVGFAVQCTEEFEDYNETLTDGDCIDNEYFQVECGLVAGAPRNQGRGRGSGGNGRGYGDGRGRGRIKRGGATPSIPNPLNRGVNGWGNKYGYNGHENNGYNVELFGYGANLSKLNIGLMAGNVLFIMLIICLCTRYFVSCCGGKRGKYERTKSEEDIDEEIAGEAKSLF